MARQAKFGSAVASEVRQGKPLSQFVVILQKTQVQPEILMKTKDREKAGRPVGVYVR